MDAEQKFRLLAHLIEAMPPFGFGDGKHRPKEEIQWLGRIAALIELNGDVVDLVSFRTDAAKLGSPLHSVAVLHIRQIAYRALAKAELQAPASVQGSFISVGHEFDALVAIGRVLSQATGDVLMVDPYMDVAIIERFCPLANEGVTLRLLTDEAGMKPSFSPSVTAWNAQHDGSRPLNARKTRPRELHDRLILMDNKEAWLLTQSFKDFADRSPGSIARADISSARLKIDFYSQAWSTATPI